MALTGGDGPGLGGVVPLVRAHPNEGGAPSDDLASPVIDVLAGSLVVLYAFDDGTRGAGPRFHLVTHRDRQRLAVDERILAAAAQDNLLDRLDDLQILERPDGCGMVQLDGHLEASTLLVPQLWQDVAQILGDDVVLAVPAPDVVLFGSAGNQTTMSALRSARDRALAVSPVRITEQLFRFTAGAWQVEPE